MGCDLGNFLHLTMKQTLENGFSSIFKISSMQPNIVNLKCFHHKTFYKDTNGALVIKISITIGLVCCSVNVNTIMLQINLIYTNFQKKKITKIFLNENLKLP